MSTLHELESRSLRRTCPPETFGFTSTEELAGRDEVPLAQTRADEAISLALDTNAKGYNISATGPAGVGKRTRVQERLHERAHRRTTPMDWVYLHNFSEPRRPIAAPLPSGGAQALAADIRRFLEDAHSELTTAFESET